MLRRRVIGRRLVRTAAVGGVAYAAGHHMATKSAQQSQTDAQQNAQIDDLQQQQDVPQQPAPPPPVYQQPAPVYQQPAPPPPPAAAPAPSGGLTDDKIEQLKQLGALRESGVLTEAEFDAAKQKILSSF
jgi:Short C-terminal domain